MNTTPRPLKSLLDLLRDSKVVVTRGSTFENAANLPHSFLERMRQQYEGTRLGRQELYAALLEDTPGALWQRQQLEASEVLSDTQVGYSSRSAAQGSTRDARVAGP